MEGSSSSPFGKTLALSVSKGHMLQIVCSLYCSSPSWGKSNFVPKRCWEPSAILQLFAQPKAARPGHWSSSLLGDAAHSCRKWGSNWLSLQGLVTAARGPAPPRWLCTALLVFLPTERQQKQCKWVPRGSKSCWIGYLDQGSKVKPHVHFFLWQIH